MRSFRAALLVMLCGNLFAACSESAGPSAPSAFAPPSAPGPVTTPGPSKAVLIVSEFTISVFPHEQPGLTYLNATFRLTETGGQSGATITSITTSTDLGSEMTGPSCWVDAIRIPPGTTIETFGADADRLVYCRPFAIGNVRTTRLVVDISFSDDDGRAGSVLAEVAVPR